MAQLALSGSTNLPGAVYKCRRDLFVGLGAFGSSVTDAIVCQWHRNPASRLSQCLAVRPCDLSADLADCHDRRAIRQGFIHDTVRLPIYEQIRNAIEACATMPPIGQVPPKLSRRINCCVIVDITESFGSAVLLDIAALLRSSLAAHSHTMAAVLAFSENAHDRPGCFASLRELERTRRNGLGAPFHKSAVPALTPETVPFDAYWLCGDSSEVGSLRNKNERVQVMARLLSEFDMNDLSDRAAATLPVGSTPSPGYAAAGLSSAYFPYDELRLQSLLRWIKEVCKTILAPTLEVSSQQTLETLNVRMSDPKQLAKTIHARLCASPPLSLKLPAPNCFAQNRSQIAKPIKHQAGLLLQKLQGAWAEECLQPHIDTKMIQPAIDALVQETDQLVTRKPQGISRAESMVVSLTAEVEKHLVEVQRELDMEKGAQKALNDGLQSVLLRAVSSKEASPSQTPLPPWYRLFARSRVKQEIRSAQHELETWHKQIIAQVKNCSDKAVIVLSWEWTARIYRQMRACLIRENETLARLRTCIINLPEKCEALCRSKTTHPIHVDRNILTPSRQDRYLAKMWAQYGIGEKAENSFLETLLNSRHLLDRFRNLSDADAAQTFAREADEQFEEMDNLSLLDHLQAAGIEKEFVELNAWITKDVWEYATPLLKVIPTDPSRARNEISEIAALRLPDLPGLQRVDADWTYSATPPATGPSTPFSAQLCRTSHGFRLEDIPWLKVCKADYDAHPNPEQLHIVEHPEQLPEIF